MSRGCGSGDRKNTKYVSDSTPPVYVSDEINDECGLGSDNTLSRTNVCYHAECLDVVTRLDNMISANSDETISACRPDNNVQSMIWSDITNSTYRPKSVIRLDSTNSTYRPESMMRLDSTNSVYTPESMMRLDSTNSTYRPESMMRLDSTNSAYRPESMIRLDSTNSTYRQEYMIRLDSTNSTYRPDNVQSIIQSDSTLYGPDICNMQSKTFSHNARSQYGPDDEPTLLRADTTRSATHMGDDVPTVFRADTTRFAHMPYDVHTVFRADTTISETHMADDVPTVFRADTTRSAYMPDDVHTVFRADTTRSEYMPDDMPTVLRADTTRSEYMPDDMPTVFRAETTRSEYMPDDMPTLFRAETTRSEYMPDDVPTVFRAETTKSEYMPDDMPTVFRAETTRSEYMPDDMPTVFRADTARSAYMPDDVPTVFRADTTRSAYMPDDVPTVFRAETTRSEYMPDDMPTVFRAETTRTSYMPDDVPTVISSDTTKYNQFNMYTASRWRPDNVQNDARSDNTFMFRPDYMQIVTRPDRPCAAALSRNINTVTTCRPDYTITKPANLGAKERFSRTTNNIKSFDGSRPEHGNTNKLNKIDEIDLQGNMEGVFQPKRIGFYRRSKKTVGVLISNQVVNNKIPDISGSLPRYRILYKSKRPIQTKNNNEHKMNDAKEQMASTTSTDSSINDKCSSVCSMIPKLNDNHANKANISLDRNRQFTQPLKIRIQRQPMKTLIQRQTLDGVNLPTKLIQNVSAFKQMSRVQSTHTKPMNTESILSTRKKSATQNIQSTKCTTIYTAADPSMRDKPEFVKIRSKTASEKLTNTIPISKVETIALCLDEISDVVNPIELDDSSGPSMKEQLVNSGTASEPDTVDCDIDKGNYHTLKKLLTSPYIDRTEGHVRTTADALSAPVRNAGDVRTTADALSAPVNIQLGQSILGNKLSLGSSRSSNVVQGHGQSLMSFSRDISTPFVNHCYVCPRTVNTEDCFQYEPFDGNEEVSIGNGQSENWTVRETHEGFDKYTSTVKPTDGTPPKDQRISRTDETIHELLRSSTEIPKPVPEDMTQLKGLHQIMDQAWATLMNLPVVFVPIFINQTVASDGRSESLIPQSAVRLSASSQTSGKIPASPLKTCPSMETVDGISHVENSRNTVTNNFDEFENEIDRIQSDEDVQVGTEENLEESNEANGRDKEGSINDEVEGFDSIANMKDSEEKKSRKESLTKCCQSNNDLGLEDTSLDEGSSNFTYIWIDGNNSKHFPSGRECKTSKIIGDKQYEMSVSSDNNGQEHQIDRIYYNTTANKSGKSQLGNEKTVEEDMPACASESKDYIRTKFDIHGFAEDGENSPSSRKSVSPSVGNKKTISDIETEYTYVLLSDDEIPVDNVDTSFGENRFEDGVDSRKILNETLAKPCKSIQNDVDEPLHGSISEKVRLEYNQIQSLKDQPGLKEKLETRLSESLSKVAGDVTKTSENANGLSANRVKCLIKNGKGLPARSSSLGKQTSGYDKQRVKYEQTRKKRVMPTPTSIRWENDLCTSVKYCDIDSQSGDKNEGMQPISSSVEGESHKHQNTEIGNKKVKNLWWTSKKTSNCFPYGFTKNQNTDEICTISQNKQLTSDNSSFQKIIKKRRRRNSHKCWTRLKGKRNMSSVAMVKKELLKKLSTKTIKVVLKQRKLKQNIKQKMEKNLVKVKEPVGYPCKYCQKKFDRPYIYSHQKKYCKMRFNSEFKECRKNLFKKSQPTNLEPDNVSHTISDIVNNKFSTNKDKVDSRQLESDQISSRRTKQEKVKSRRTDNNRCRKTEMVGNNSHRNVENKVNSRRTKVKDIDSRRAKSRILFQKLKIYACCICGKQYQKPYLYVHEKIHRRKYSNNEQDWLTFPRVKSVISPNSCTSAEDTGVKDKTKIKSGDSFIKQPPVKLVTKSADIVCQQVLSRPKIQPTNTVFKKSLSLIIARCSDKVCQQTASQSVSNTVCKQTASQSVSNTGCKQGDFQPGMQSEFTVFKEIASQPITLSADPACTQDTFPTKIQSAGTVCKLTSSVQKVSSPARRYNCDQCNFCVISQQRLTIHRKVHLQSKSVFCHACKVMFKNMKGCKIWHTKNGVHHKSKGEIVEIMSKADTCVRNAMMIGNNSDEEYDVKEKGAEEDWTNSTKPTQSTEIGGEHGMSCGSIKEKNEILINDPVALSEDAECKKNRCKKDGPVIDMLALRLAERRNGTIENNVNFDSVESYANDTAMENMENTICYGSKDGIEVNEEMAEYDSGATIQTISSEKSFKSKRNPGTACVKCSYVANSLEGLGSHFIENHFKKSVTDALNNNNTEVLDKKCSIENSRVACDANVNVSGETSLDFERPLKKYKKIQVYAVVDECPSTECTLSKQQMSGVSPSAQDQMKQLHNANVSKSNKVLENIEIPVKASLEKANVRDTCHNYIDKEQNDCEKENNEKDDARQSNNTLVEIMYVNVRSKTLVDEDSNEVENTDGDKSKEFNESFVNKTDNNSKKEINNEQKICCKNSELCQKDEAVMDTGENNGKYKNNNRSDDKRSDESRNGADENNNSDNSNNNTGDGGTGDNNADDGNDDDKDKNNNKKNDTDNTGQSTDVELLLCLVCRTSFSIKVDLQRHLSKIHRLTNLCQLCYFKDGELKRFANPVSLRNHKLRDHPDDMVRCVCGSMLIDEKMLTSHLKKFKCNIKETGNVDNDMVKCVCGKRFGTQELLAAHGSKCRKRKSEEGSLGQSQYDEETARKSMPSSSRQSNLNNNEKNFKDLKQKFDQYKESLLSCSSTGNRKKKMKRDSIKEDKFERAEMCNNNNYYSSQMNAELYGNESTPLASGNKTKKVLSKDEENNEVVLKNDFHDALQAEPDAVIKAEREDQSDLAIDMSVPKTYTGKSQLKKRTSINKGKGKRADLTTKRKGRKKMRCDSEGRYRCKKCGGWYRRPYIYIHQKTVHAKRQWVIVPTSTRHSKTDEGARKKFRCGWCKFVSVHWRTVVHHHYSKHQQAELDVITMTTVPNE